MLSSTTTILTILLSALPLTSFASPIMNPPSPRSPEPAPEAPEVNTTTTAYSHIEARAPRFISGPWNNFPPISTWLGFDDLFGRNMNSMRATGSTWDDIGRINVAIRECAKLGVDERVILAIIMQESHGDVGVRTTISPGGIPTAGLMQCSGCSGFPGRHGLSQVCFIFFCLGCFGYIYLSPAYPPYSSPFP